MKTILTTAAALLAFTAGAAHAEGDVAKGKKDFKKCKACHTIAAPDGETIVKGGKIGPNLWGVVGRTAGTEPDYGKYDEAMIKLGEQGLVWTPEMLAEYIPNAKKFLEAQTGDKARTQMTPQRVKDVNDVIAFLSQYGPADSMSGDTDMDSDAGGTEDGN